MVDMMDEDLLTEQDKPTLDSFVGQRNFVETMKVSITSAKMRGEHLSHILLIGPRGSGKSTLAKAIANELGADTKVLSLNALREPSDLVSILTWLKEGDVVLAENFDCIKPTHADVLTSAMDSFYVDIVLGKGTSARDIRLQLPRFTVIATMDKEKKIPSKIRDCFSITWKMNDYSVTDLKELTLRFAQEHSVTITDDASYKIATYANGSYRKLSNVLKMARDFASIKNDGIIDVEIIEQIIALVQDGLELKCCALVGASVDNESPESDPMLEDAIDVVLEAGLAYTTLLQRKLKIGYSRATRILDEMEERGIISAYDGKKPSKVLINKKEKP